MRLTGIFAAASLLLLLSSCTTIPENHDEGDTEESVERQYETWRDLRTPITDRLELPRESEVVREIAPSPLWLPDELPHWVWLPESTDGSLLFLGTSYPRMSRTNELEECINNAARQAAQFAGIAAIVSSYQLTRGKDTGYAEDICLYYNKDIVSTLVREAEVRTLHQNDTGSYALISFPSLKRNKSFLGGTEQFSGGNDEPSWVTNTPGLNGYFVGLGISRPKIRFADSVAYADEAAVAEILRQLATTVDVAYDISKSSEESDYTEENYQYTTALVRGIQIAARWRDPSGDYFYSLALLPKP